MPNRQGLKKQPVKMDNKGKHKTKVTRTKNGTGTTIMKSVTKMATRTITTVVTVVKRIIWEDFISLNFD